MLLFRRLAFILVLFAVIFSAGTAAFILVEGWPFLDALYMTVITLSTVGYGEVHPLSGAGRLVAMALILGGAGTLAYGLSVVTAFIVEGELHNVLGQRRMERALERLRNQVVVCGAGETGKAGSVGYNPDPSTPLQAGDGVIVCAQPDQLDALRGLLRGEGK